jgi:hypothetical protein
MRIPSRFGRNPPPPSAADEDTLVDLPPAHVATGQTIRRELKTLLEKREVDIRDLGGLALEMIRRDRFRQELLVERAEDILAAEDRIRELDMIVTAGQTAKRRGGGLTCRCGTPYEPGARFCWRCGRAAEHTMPLVPCKRCRASLPADAAFCPACGTPTVHESTRDATFVRPGAGNS